MTNNKLIVGISGAGKTATYIYETIKKEAEEERNFTVFCRITEVPFNIFDILLENQYSIVITNSTTTLQNHPAEEKRIAIFFDIEDSFSGDYSDIYNKALVTLMNEYIAMNDRCEEFIPTTVFVDDLLLCKKLNNLLSCMEGLRYTTVHFVLTTQSLSNLQEMYSPDFLNTLMDKDMVQVIVMTRKNQFGAAKYFSDSMAQQMVESRIAKEVPAYINE